MNIKNFEKVMSNAEKLTEKSNSNKVFLQSLKILKPNKSNFLHKLIFGIIEILVSTMKQKLFLQILMIIFRLVLDFELFQLERMKKTIANM